ncbi:MAG: electron transfer flavoprotein subunit alpha/FixB family protein, partial [Streptosporangiaceae bacterium]
MSVLVLAELDGEEVADVSLRALTLARDLTGDLAGDSGEKLAAAVFTGDGELPGPAADQLAAYGVADVYAVDLPGYAPAAWARALAVLSEPGRDRAGPVTAVLAAATDRGSEVLAHLGAITGEPVAANCVSVTPAGTGRWELVRQRWAGSLLEDAELEAALALLTVAADAVPARLGTETAASTVHVLRPDIPAGDLRVRAVESAERGGGVSLATARVVVGGGRGVGGPDGFAPLEELAGLLGGALGVSRVVTSQGWRPHRQQVGQTGTKISPELYLACGISGAIQHMAGCLSA